MEPIVDPPPTRTGAMPPASGARCGAALLLSAALIGALTSCAEPGDGVPPPRRILLITVDTLRADHLGFLGYHRDTSPVLDRLAAGGVVFENAIAQWPKTGASMASMFTGLYPQTTGLTHRAAIRLPEPYEVLPEFLRSRGYTTAAVVANAVLSDELGWSAGFDEYVETWKLAPGPLKDPLEWRRAMNAERLTEEALAVLERNASAERLFLWLHYLDPHAPYALPEGAENPFLDDAHYSAERRIGKWFPRDWILDERPELDFYVAQYDANIRIVDRSIGSVLARAEELGLMRETLTVFTADHGESLGERNYVGHGRLPYNSSLHVPLMMVYPEAFAGARRVSTAVEFIDLYPTIRALVDPSSFGDSLLAEAEPAEGRRLAGLFPAGDADAGEDLRYVFSGAGAGGKPWQHFRTVQDGRWKLIHHREIPRRHQPLLWELYDLQADPAETTNLIESEPAHAARLRDQLARWTAERRDAGEGSREGEGQSEETLEALRALGYVN